MKQNLVRQTWERLSLLARAATILGATFRVRLDMRRNEFVASSSISTYKRTLRSLYEKTKRLKFRERDETGEEFTSELIQYKIALDEL